MSAFKKTLEPFYKDDVFHRCYTHITTTDGNPGSYKLNEKVRDRFLEIYSQCLKKTSFDGTLHLSVDLNSLTSHCLVIDVVYEKASGNVEVLTDCPLSDARLLHNHVAREIIDEMHTTISTEKMYIFDGYFLTRAGTTNSHLIFPYLFLDRHDYCWFIERLCADFPFINNNQNWLLHGSTERTGMSAYELVSKIGYDKKRSFSYNFPKKYVIENFNKSFPKKTLPFILVNLLYPGYNILKANLPCHAYYDKIVVTTYLEQPVLGQENAEDPRLSKDHLFDYRERTSKDNVYKSVYSVLKSFPNQELIASDEDCFTGERKLFEWVKTNQNNCEFIETSPIIDVYLFRFFPPKIDQCNAQSEAGVSGLQTLHGAPGDEEDDVQRLVREFNGYFSLDEIRSVIDDYKMNYSTVWSNVCESMLESDDNRRFKQYTSRSILYDLANRFGENLVNLNNCCYVSKCVMKGLCIIIRTREIESFNDYISQNILPLIPFKICDKEIRMFNWEGRHWQGTMKVSDFLNLLVTSLFDQCLLDSTDDEQKIDMRRVRRKFVEEGKNLQTGTVFKRHGYERFDRNPWIVGLPGGNTFDVINLTTRRTIPEDYICGTMNPEDVYGTCAHIVDKKLQYVVPQPYKAKRQMQACHFPEMTCSKEKSSRCGNIGCKMRTKVKCSTCNIFLCLTTKRNCYTEFHS